MSKFWKERALEVKRNEEIQALVTKYMGFSLAPVNHDAEDFHDIHVVTLHRLLNDVYAAGVRAGVVETAVMDVEFNLEGKS